ncbi:hypothetical protein L1049_009673 [Liquidambar formosana]|uniref:Cation/H+ exchanger transmembrane domain-containing protein n=1 Tax=Liquidambar formosana TaxID=63359 RepID=A0AAP0N7P3_LIQFO
MAEETAGNKTDNTIVCYAPTMITTSGIWQGDNPLDYSLPLFILQLTLVVVTTRVLVFLLKPFRQPRVISEIMGGVSLSVTAFPVLARILAELKLLNTELGRIATVLGSCQPYVCLGSLSCSHCFSRDRRYILGFLMDSTLKRIIRCVLHFSHPTSDAIGTHSVFGAFVFGLVIPNGPLGLTLIEKLEDFVSGLLLPLFCAISGLKTDVKAIQGAATWGILALVTFLSCVGKVAGTLLVALFYKMPFREGVTLGLLMNTKGLVEMIVLNVGKDQKAGEEVHTLQTKNNRKVKTRRRVMNPCLHPYLSKCPNNHQPSRRLSPHQEIPNLRLRPPPHRTHRQSLRHAHRPQHSKIKPAGPQLDPSLIRSHY